MKTRYLSTLFISLLAASFVLAQSGTAKSGLTRNGALLPQNAAVVGVWRGDFEGSPWATITITEEGGTLAGAILFYLHRREPGGQMTVTAGSPEPLLKPQLKGNVLTCEVSHRRAHPPKSLTSPPVRFRMTITSANHATLVNEDEPNLTAALVRSDY